MGYLRYNQGSLQVSGKTLLNINGANLGPNFMFKNMLKAAQWGYDNSALPLLDASGYLTSNAYTGNVGCVVQLPSGYSGRYKITWKGSGPRTAFQGPSIRVFSGGSFYLGNSTFSGTDALVEFDFSVAVSAAASGTGGVVRLTVPAIPSTDTTNTFVYLRNGEAGLATGWYKFTQVDSTHMDLPGTTFTGNTTGGWAVYTPTTFYMAQNNTDPISGFSDLILVRSSAPYAGDLAAVQSGVLTDQFNDDNVAYIRALNPKVLRWMDNTAANNATCSRVATRPPSTAITFNSSYLVPNCLVGAISGTTTLTASAYPSMPGSWTEGETFQGIMSSTVPYKAVNGAASGTGGTLRLSFASAHGITNGQRILFSGYNNGINPGVNGSGIWNARVVDSTHIELISGYAGLDSVFAEYAAWTSGGRVYTTTVNVGARGPKLVIPFGSQTGTGSEQPYTLNAGDQCTFVYDALQDAVMVVNSLLYASIPLAYRVAYCNLVNKDYLHNFSHLYSTAEVATETAYIRDNLTNSCFFESSNELWNQGFAQCQYMMIKQMNWGMQPYDHGLAGASAGGWLSRVQLAQAKTTWGARAGFQPVISVQSSGNGNLDIQQYCLEGKSLNGTAFPRYAAAGNPNYDTAPNRPVDFCNWLSHAPYYNGFHLAFGGTYEQMSAVDLTDLTTAADNYALGTGPGIAAAYAYFDRDVRQGTVKTAAISSITGGNTFNTAAPHGLPGPYWRTVAFRNVGGTLPTGVASYTAYNIINETSTSFQIASVSAPTIPLAVSGGSGTTYVGILGQQTLLFQHTYNHTGFAAAAALYGKNLLNYEGGYGGTPTTQGQCTSFGISTAYGATPDYYLSTGGKVYDAMQAWKSSSNFQAVVTQQLTEQVAAATAVGVATMLPGWYPTAEAGGLANDPWAIFKTDIYGFPYVYAGQSIYYASFDAIKAFNT